LTDYEHPSREGREASYYELALSNRQVFLAVFGLLLGIAGAFLAGVWFARSSAPAPRIAQSLPPVEARVKEAVGEYNFFSEKERAPPPAAVPAPSPPDLPVVKDPTPSADVAPAPAPASQTAAAAVANAPASTVPAGAASASGASGASATAADLFVQVFSSADVAQAKRVLGQLQRVGYKGFIAPLPNVNGQTLHRVRVGPYRERDVAQKAADAIRQKLKFSTWITNTQ
jgi:cell division septation protein DedD